MAVIYLIRHGQANTLSADYDKLSDVGRTQAKLLAEHLAVKIPQVDTVVTGSMLRHQQTAELVLGEKFVAPVLDSGWNEYHHQEILAGLDERLRTPDGIKQFFIDNKLPKNQFRNVFMQAIDKWIAAGDSGQYPESWMDFELRVNNAFDKLVQSAKNTQIVFTSGGAISLIASRLLGLPSQRFMEINWNLVNAGITKILVNTKTGDTALSCLNEHHVFDQPNHRDLITYT